MSEERRLEPRGVLPSAPGEEREGREKGGQGGDPLGHVIGCDVCNLADALGKALPEGDDVGHDASASGAPALLLPRWGGRRRYACTIHHIFLPLTSVDKAIMNTLKYSRSILDI